MNPRDISNGDELLKVPVRVRIEYYEVPKRFCYLANGYVHDNSLEVQKLKNSKYHSCYKRTKKQQIIYRYM